jgi:hypothetical protein
MTVAVDSDTSISFAVVSCATSRMLLSGYGGHATILDWLAREAEYWLGPAAVWEVAATSRVEVVR